MHICTYYCHGPYHATNAVVSVPAEYVDKQRILEYLWAIGEPVEEIERIIPATEVVDLEAWVRQYEDGHDFVLPGDRPNYGIVIVAKYKEDEIGHDTYL